MKFSQEDHKQMRCFCQAGLGPIMAINFFYLQIGPTVRLTDKRLRHDMVKPFSSILT